MKNYLDRLSIGKKKTGGGGSKSLTLILFLLLGLFGMSQTAWAKIEFVVGVTGTGTSSRYGGSNYNKMKLNAQFHWGGTDKNWLTNEMSKAGLTFEGLDLYITSMTYNDAISTRHMQFQKYNGTTQVYSWDAYDGVKNQDYWENQIVEYGSGKYSKLTMGQSKVYFDATGWSETAIKLCVGHANYQKYYSMTNVTGTKLYYTNSLDSWSDAMGFGIVGNTSASNGTNWLTNVSDKAKEYTGFIHYGLNNNNANPMYLVTNAGKAGEKPTCTYNENYTSLNSTQTIKCYIKSAGSAEFTQQNAPGTINITSYELTAQGTTTKRQPTLGTSASSQTVSACRTATTTLEAPSVDGYTFNGWYNESGTQLSSSATYTYYPTTATTVSARYTENTFAVTVSAGTGISAVSGGGENVGQITGTAINATVATGYTWKQWEITSGSGSFTDGATTQSTTFKPTAAATITATATAKTYDVTLDKNGGDTDGSGKVTFGAKSISATNFVAPTRFGYHVYGGYYTKAVWNESGSQLIANTSRTLSKSTDYTDSEGAWSSDGGATLYTRWVGDKYNVAYNGYGNTGGSMSMQENITFGAGTKLTQNAFVKTGHTFQGWSTSEGGAKAYDDKQSADALYTAENCTTQVYAVWTPNVNTIVFNANTGSGDQMANQTFTYGETAKALSANTYAKTGYHFIGWARTAAGDVEYTDGQVISNITTATETINLYAKWEPNVTNITVYRNYNNDDNTTESAVTAYYDCTIGQVTGLPETGYSRTGYNHNGLYLARSGGSYLMKYNSSWVFGNVSDYCTATYWKYAAGGALNLYSQWSAKTYNIHFDTNGGTTASFDRTFTYDAVPAASGVPTHSTDNFAGYAIGSAEGTLLYNAAGQLIYPITNYTDNTGKWIYDGAITLYARWMSNYTITLDGDGATTPGTTSVDVNPNTTILTSIAEVPAKTGYTFGGYYTAKNGGGTQLITDQGNWIVPTASYIDSDGKWIFGSNATLFAKWTANVTNLSFDKQSGTGGANSRTLTYNSITNMDNIECPTREGYTFEGYYTEAEGAGTKLITNVGAWLPNIEGYTGELSNNKPKWMRPTAGALTLYANWTENIYDLQVVRQYFDCVGSGSSINTAPYADVTENHANAIGNEQSYTIEAFAAVQPGFYHLKWRTSTGEKITWNGTTFDATSSAKDITGAKDLTSITINGFRTSDNNAVKIYDRWREYKSKVNMSAVNGIIQGDSTQIKNVGIYTAGSVTAIANEGYHFTGWSKSENTDFTITIASPGELTTNVTVTAIKDDKVAGTITANFAETKHTTAIAYKCGDNAIADQTTSGQAGIASTVQVTAPTITGYTFSTWELTEGVTLAAGSSLTNASININITADSKTITAKYTEDMHIVHIVGGTEGSASAGIATTGSATAATAATGKHFTEWTIPTGITLVDCQATDQAITFNATADDIVITANYAYTNYTITMVVSPEGTGSIDPATKTDAHVGVPFSVTAIPETGYSFANWTSSVDDYNNPDIVFNLKNLDDVSSPARKADAGIVISNNGDEAKDGNATLVHATNATLTASFTEDLHSVTVVSNDNNKGTVSTASVSDIGIATKSGEITATALAGYYFTGWTIPDGVQLAEGYTDKQATIKIHATADEKTITANFAGKYAFRGSLKEDGDPTGGMPGWSSNDPITFTEGIAAVQYTLLANKNYKFKLRDISSSSYAGYQTSGYIAMNDAYHLFNGGNDVWLATQGAGTYTFNIRFNNGTPEVMVAGPTSYQVTFGTNDNAKGTVAATANTVAFTTGQYVADGSTVVFTPTPATGCELVEWNSAQDGTGTQLSTDIPYTISAYAGDPAVVYGIFKKTDYAITYPSGGHYNVVKTLDQANYQDNVSFTITPTDGYRLAVTAKDADNNDVSLTHTDLSYSYSFTMPASAVTISVVEHPYKIGGNFVNGGGSAGFDSEKYTLDASGSHTFALNAKTSYKFKVWNENYTGQADHYMGSSGDWNIEKTSTDLQVTCEGAACFVLKTGIAGDYTITVRTGADNKPKVDVTYPNESKLVYGGADYYFTQVGETGVYKAGPLALAAGQNIDNQIQMYWEGTCIKNDNDQRMTVSSHTDWGMERYTSGNYYIKIATVSSTYQTNPDNYYFYYKPDTKKLTAEYPSYWRGDAGTTLGWGCDNPMKFVDDVATISLDVQTDGDREMKVLVDGQYWTYEGKISTSTNNIQFVSDPTPNKSAFKFNVAASMKGNYTFTFDRSTHQMNVAYPDVVQYSITYTDAEGTKTIMAGPNGGKAIKAADKPGYKFTGWTIGPVDDYSYVTVSGNDKTKQTTTVYGHKDGGSITANYSNANFIYFKNVPNWGDVYVHFYKGSYWDSKKGSGSATSSASYLAGPFHMTKIDKTDVWYLDYSAAGVNISQCDGHVSFTSSKQQNQNNFDQCQVVYRGDFGTCAPMMVPINWIDEYLNEHEGYRTCYYEQGHWMTYGAAAGTTAGIELHIYDYDGSKWNDITGSPFVLKADNDGSYSFSTDEITLTRDPNYIYHIKLSGCSNGKTWYGNPGKMTSSSCSNWVMSVKAQDMEFESTTQSPYTFRLSTGNGQLKLSAVYPLAVGDLRIMYHDGDGDHVTGYTYKGNVAKTDTASFIINTAKSERSVNIQKCTNVAEPATWANVKDDQEQDIVFANPSENGIYNFIFSHDASGNVTEVKEPEKYTGNFYVVSNALGGGWKNYKANSDNLMTNSEYSLTHSSYAYNYYVTKWVTNGTSVKFNIANDYNTKLLLNDKIGDDIIGGNAIENLPANANVRFMWNSNTNTLQRAYISGSSVVSDRFLVMTGTSSPNKVFDTDGNAFNVTGLEANEQIFTDKGNWVYQIDMKAQPTATATISAKYNGKIENFKTDVVVIGGEYSEGATKYLMRAVYDFKTDKLVTAWLPDNTLIPISSELPINAEVMLVRHAQNAAQQITFTGGSLTGVKTIYGAIELKREEMVGKLDTWDQYAFERCIYYISFPFDVKVSEIFGLGDYGTTWQLQRYRGDLRAQNGWFAETSTFWEKVDKNATLNKYEGYALQLSKSACNSATSAIWKNVKEGASLYLYFPSTTETAGTISSQEMTISVPNRPCSIDRYFTQDQQAYPDDQTKWRNHTQTDSHWNMIGLPVFQDEKGNPQNIFVSEVTKDQWKYLYAWNTADNSMAIATVDDDFTFKSMHGYMVQYHGDIKWTGSAIVPAAVAARFMDEEKNYKIDLQVLNNNEERVSRTYVELAEGANDGFQLNEDVYMMSNSAAAGIYSFAGGYDVAANVLSVNNHEIPLGIEVKTAGTYTFHMPSEFSGIATLVDKVANTKTILNADDYSVYLDKGTCEGRFVLKLEIKAKPTSTEMIDAEGDKIFKFIRNEQLYILRDGVIYNATGSVVE